MFNILCFQRQRIYFKEDFCSSFDFGDLQSLLTWNISFSAKAKQMKCHCI